MTPKSSYVLVGVFVLVLGAAFIAGLLWLTTGGPPKNYEGYLVYMTESVSGLNVDAEVKYKGVNVGRVEEIGLDPRNPERVRIVLLVLEDTPVKADTVATMELQGITGIARLNLSGGTSEAPLLEPPEGEQYAIIPSRPSLLTRLDDTVSELLASLIKTSDRVSFMLNEENQVKISATLANTEQLTNTLGQRAEDLNRLITSADELLDNMNAAARDLPQLLEQFNSTAAALETMAGSLANAGVVLEETSLDLQRTVADSGSDVRTFTANTLPQANSLIVELKMTARNLRQVSESLQADPSRLLFGAPPQPPGPGE